MYSKEGKYLDAIDEYEKARRLIPTSKKSIAFSIIWRLPIST